MAGIINIVLKKNQQRGINGSFDVFAGFPLRYNATANLNYRSGKFNFFGSYGFQYRESPGRSFQQRFQNDNDTLNLLIQEDDFLPSEYSHTVRAGLDYIFKPKTTFTGAFTYNIGLGENTNNIRYLEYINEDEFIGGKNRNFIEKEKEPNIDWNLTFKKSFDKEGQEL
jgi:hypothetical protein